MKEQLELIRERAQDILDELALLEARLDETQQQLQSRCAELTQYTDRFMGR